MSSTDVPKGTGTDDTCNALATAATPDRERFLAQEQPTRRPCSGPVMVSVNLTLPPVYSFGFAFRSVVDYYTTTEIPDQVKQAQVELAVYLHNNVDGLGLSGLEDFQNLQVGSINITQLLWLCRR